MARKALVAAVMAVLVVGLGLSLWARSVLTGEGVRTVVARQISEALGQPVTIGGLRAGLLPRVTMTLDDVRVGEPPRIAIGRLHIGTNLAALVSRRIEHATLRVDDAHVQLPLAPLTLDHERGRAHDTASSVPVELVSVDRIVLNGVEVSSGGRALIGDLTLVPGGPGRLHVARGDLRVGETAVTITGEISDLARPAGELALKAGALDLDALLAFASDFSGGAQGPIPRAAAPTARGQALAPDGSTGMDIVLSIDADRATLGGLALDGLSARARMTPAGVALDPITFGVFAGRYAGSLAFKPASRSAFDFDATLDGVDTSAVVAFFGHPGLVTGRLSARLNLAGRGTTADAVLGTAHGTARVDITDGTVHNLGLLRAVVLATSMRESSKAEVDTSAEDEPFSHLSATWTVGGGAARTDDLHFESTDVAMTAAGSLGFDSSAVDLTGRVQLSEELTSKAGTDLARYTSEQGRITLPVTVSGTADALQVRVDVADLARRALTNRAKEEAGKAIERNLPDILRRR